MTKKEIKELAKISYTNDQLDEKKVINIVKILNRRDLKRYIHSLLQNEQEKNVIIALPKANGYNESEKVFEKIFSNKRIEYQNDPSLLLGAKIQVNDIIYDFSLKEKLENAEETIEKNYE